VKVRVDFLPPATLLFLTFAPFHYPGLFRHALCALLAYYTPLTVNLRLADETFVCVGHREPSGDWRAFAYAGRAVIWDLLNLQHSGGTWFGGRLVMVFYPRVSSR